LVEEEIDSSDMSTAVHGDATELFQTQRTAANQWRIYAGFCQEAYKVESPAVTHRGKFCNQPRHNRRRKTAAPPPPSEKMRRVDESVE